MAERLREVAEPAVSAIRAATASGVVGSRPVLSTGDHRSEKPISSLPATLNAARIPGSELP